MNSLFLCVVSYYLIGTYILFSKYYNEKVSVTHFYVFLSTRHQELAFMILSSEVNIKKIEKR